MVSEAAILLQLVPCLALLCSISLSAGQRTNPFRDGTWLRASQQKISPALELLPSSSHLVIADGQDIRPTTVPAVIRRRSLSSPGIRGSATPGQVKLARIRRAMAARGAKLFFNVMDNSGFTPVVANLVAKYPTTLLVPTDTIVARRIAYITRLTKDQRQQLVGYHILKGFYPKPFLIAVKEKTEFATADYDLTVAKKTEKNAPRVGLAPPKSKIPTAYVTLGGVYADRTVTAHIISALLIPPKFQ